MYPSLTLSAAGPSLTRPVPSRWAISLDVRLARNSGVQVRVGSASVGYSSGVATKWRHIELTPGQELLDGHSLSSPLVGGPAVSVGASQGRVQVRALIISDARDPAGLLVQRLAELHARLRGGQFPVGADRGDHLHIDSSYWTSGFWPGALWQAAALLPGAGGAMFGRWALAATVAHFGQESADTHDVGFEYGQSSLAGWQALCQQRPLGKGAPCGRLRESALAAADDLLRLASTNGHAGTIPTNSSGPRADTIIDSMMNVAILPWASSVSAIGAYRQIALRHAHAVARLLVRPDGSTAQAVDFDRATGRVQSIGTHQGLSASSTWSRGQAWAVYGFSVAAQELGDRSLLRVALRAAAYVRRRLPAGGIPRWDYDAPAGAPVDVSAGVITAVGLFHLAQACKSLPGVCGDTTRLVQLARRMLAASLARASPRPPIGFLPDQVLNQRGHGCWCNGGELMFGVTYALEGLNLERRPGVSTGSAG